MYLTKINTLLRIFFIIISYNKVKQCNSATFGGINCGGGTWNGDTLNNVVNLYMGNCVSVGACTAPCDFSFSSSTLNTFSIGGATPDFSVFKVDFVGWPDLYSKLGGLDFDDLTIKGLTSDNIADLFRIAEETNLSQLNFAGSEKIDCCTFDLITYPNNVPFQTYSCTNYATNQVFQVTSLAQTSFATADCTCNAITREKDCLTDLCSNFYWNNESSTCNLCEAGYKCKSGVRTKCQAGTFATAGSTNCSTCQVGSSSGCEFLSCDPTTGKLSNYCEGDCKEGFRKDVVDNDPVCVHQECPREHFADTDLPELKNLDWAFELNTATERSESNVCASGFLGRVTHFCAKNKVNESFGIPIVVNECLPCYGTISNTSDCVNCENGDPVLNCLLHLCNTTENIYGQLFCETCETGFYLEETTGKCQLCSSSCSVCNGPTASDCIGCADGYEQSDSFCALAVQGGSEALSGGPIAGIVIGSLVAVIGALILVLVFIKRRRKTQKTKARETALATIGMTDSTLTTLRTNNNNDDEDKHMYMAPGSIKKTQGRETMANAAGYDTEMPIYPPVYLAPEPENYDNEFIDEMYTVPLALSGSEKNIKNYTVDDNESNSNNYYDSDNNKAGNKYDNINNTAYTVPEDTKQNVDTPCISGEDYYAPIPTPVENCNEVYYMPIKPTLPPPPTTTTTTTAAAATAATATTTTTTSSSSSSSSSSSKNDNQGQNGEDEYYAPSPSTTRADDREIVYDKEIIHEKDIEDKSGALEENEYQ